MIDDSGDLAFDLDTTVRSIVVEIEAPASVVWDVLTDLDKYCEWNPHCVRCESTLEMGAPVRMKLKTHWDPNALMDAVEYICAFEPGRRLSWAAPYEEKWPYPARRDQVITSLGEDRCSYYSTDAFFGDTGIHVMRMAGPWVKAWFDSVACALKARAEAVFLTSRAIR